MTMTVGMVALLALLVLCGLWGWRSGAAVRAYYQGRRDQLAGSVDRHRFNHDHHYLHGAVTQYLQDVGGAGR
jgi:hypothetical protein